MTTANRVSKLGLDVSRREGYIGAGTVIGLVIVVVAARASRHLSGVRTFISDHPGTVHVAGAPVGVPVWVAVLHALNALFMLFVIRSGWQIHRPKRTTMFWTRTMGPSRRKPTKISLDLWLHITTDTLWMITGLVFYVLLFATGQWRRIVPTEASVFPNAVSAALQYASLNWPGEHGWVEYNSLQILSYFVITFIAAPLAIITGLRMSPSWPTNATAVNRFYPIEVARKIHFPTMLVFVAFIVVHVVAVLATGALANLNHMYAARDATGWLGLGIFVATVVVMAGLYVGARPVVLRSIASLTGKVSR